MKKSLAVFLVMVMVFATIFTIDMPFTSVRANEVTDAGPEIEAQATEVADSTVDTKAQETEVTDSTTDTEVQAAQATDAASDKETQTIEANSVAGTTYYVDSAAGNDQKDGKSAANAWRSLDKVNATTFLPGDKILFKAGGAWHGQLWPKGSGTEGAPIMIDKYGEGTSLPCINGDGIKRQQYATGAVMLRNQEYWEINNLEITNDDDFNTDLVTLTTDASGKATNIRDGILIINDADMDTAKRGLTMHHIYINNCYIHDVDSPNTWPGFANGGIILHVVGTVDFTASVVPKYTFDNIRVQYNRIEKCDLLAFMNYNETTKTSFQDEISQFDLWHTNLYIGHNYMKNIGQGGIDICDAKDAVVEYNILDGWSKRYTRECAGIYPWKSFGVVFQNNEVYDGPTDNDTHGDGTAFDFDSPNIDITYQYNYTHNNPMGWMSYLGRSANNIARYNISDNDGSRIIRFGYFDNDSTPAYFLNNVFLFHGTKMQFSDYTDRFRAVDYYFNNNVFYDTNTGTNSTFWKSSPSSYGTAKFSNNCFYTVSGRHEPGEPNDPNKITTNPLFVNPGQAPTRDANGLLSGATVWEGYKLQAGSPLIDKGTYISQMGSRDFYGTPLQYGSAPDIGVQEVVQGAYVKPTEPVVSENYAKGKTVTVQYGSSSGSSMVDQNTATYWTSNTVDPQYIEINFSENKTFNKIISSEYIKTPPTSGNYTPVRPAVRNYHFEKWDGTQWVTFFASYGIGDNKVDVFTSVTTSKIRMVLEDPMNTPRIAEIQVYSDTGAVPGAPVEIPTETPASFQVIAHYNFDNVTGSTIADTSANGLNGTKSSSVTASTDAKSGKSLYFGANGTKKDGYISIPNHALLNRSNLTISMWIKPDAYSLSKSNECIVLYSKGSNVNECYSSTIITTDVWGDPVGGIQSPMILSASTTSNVKGARWSPTSTAGTTDLVKAGEWSQIVQTYDQYKYSVYVNGKLFMSIPYGAATNLYMNTSNLLIGNQSTTGKSPYYGYMDEVLILDQALSANQVKALYAGNLQGITAQ